MVRNSKDGVYSQDKRGGDSFYLVILLAKNKCDDDIGDKMIVFKLEPVFRTFV